ncbi:hypothetical protein SDC9_202320 [bioreactor metagenome]|uniref:Uncharacterized protein n=1 Tax=bioreactor metagenome TaxID=1076179 RepID=A0A645ITC7_9ZZZZ
MGQPGAPDAQAVAALVKVGNPVHCLLLRLPKAQFGQERFGLTG